MMTNRLGWRRGYFQTIASWPLLDGEALPRRCFEARRDPPDYPNLYFDEHGVKLARRVEPCGEWALHSYLTVDDAISTALGIPRQRTTEVETDAEIAEAVPARPGGAESSSSS